MLKHEFPIRGCHDTSQARAHIRQFLGWLTTGWPDGTCVELRALPRGNRPTMAGFFAPDPAGLDAAAHAAAVWGGGQAQVYVGINPRRDGLLDEVARNRMVPTGRAGRLGDVVAVTAVLVDLDPVRPKGTASTDAELAAARDVARAVVRWWLDQGWRHPLVAMSGNGWHLWARVPPQDPASFPARLRAFLADLAQRFGGGAVDVDLSVADAPRIAKVPGTVSVKGQNTKERPWRRSRVAVWEDPEPDAALAGHILSLSPAGQAPRAAGRRPESGSREKKSRQQLDRVLSRCRFFLWAAGRPADVREPAWYALATNLAVFEGGREAFHWLSEGHPGYRRDEADRKFGHAERDAPGPTTCRRLAELGEMGFVCPLIGVCPAKAPAALAHFDDQEWTALTSVPSDPNRMRAAVDVGTAINAVRRNPGSLDWAAGIVAHAAGLGMHAARKLLLRVMESDRDIRG